MTLIPIFFASITLISVTLTTIFPTHTILTLIFLASTTSSPAILTPTFPTPKTSVLAFFTLATLISTILALRKMHLILIQHVIMLGAQKQNKTTKSEVQLSNNLQKPILKISLLSKPILRMQLILSILK